jgi:hypothetical protein
MFCGYLFLRMQKYMVSFYLKQRLLIQMVFIFDISLAAESNFVIIPFKFLYYQIVMHISVSIVNS